MKIWGIVGHPKSGKSALIDALLLWMDVRDFTVCVVKKLALPRQCPEPASAQGGRQIAPRSVGGWGLVYEVADVPLTTIAELLPTIERSDVMLVEGLDVGAHPKIEVYMSSSGREPMCAHDASIVALVNDRPVAPDIPAFAHEDIAGVGCWLVSASGLVLPAHYLALAMQA